MNAQEIIKKVSNTDNYKEDYKSLYTLLRIWKTSTNEYVPQKIEEYLFKGKEKD